MYPKKLSYIKTEFLDIFELQYINKFQICEIE